MEPFKQARRRGRRGLLAVSLVGLAAFTTACGESSDAGGSSTTTAAGSGPVKVSVVMGFGGPYGRVVENAYRGFEASVKDVNARGGVDGRQIELVKVDHKETTAGGVAACKEVQSNGSLVGAVLEGNAGANTSAAKCLDNAGIPTLFFATTTDPSLRSAFTYLATAADEGKTIAGYVDDDAKLRGTKVGVIHDSGEAYVQQKDAFEEQAKSLGIDVAATEEVTATQSSFVPVLTKMKDAGVETVVVFATAEAPGIWRDAKAIDYRPSFTGSGYVFSFISAAARDDAAGVTGLSKSATPESDGYAAYEERMRAHGTWVPRAEDQGFVLYGAGELLIEILKRTRGDLDADGFVKAAETLESYDNGILPPISYTDDHFGTSGGFPAVCCSPDATWRAAGAPIG